MNNLYVKLLEEMNKHGVGKYYNASPFIVANFPRPSYKEPWGWNDKEDYEPKNFLGQLKARGHIEYELEGIYDAVYYYKLGINGELIIDDKWFDNVGFNIRLTIEGMNYLNEYKLTQSNIEINEASKRNSRTQNFFSVATIIVAGVSACVSYQTNKNENVNSNEIKNLKRQIEVLSNSNKETQSKQTPEQNPKAYPQAPSRKR